MFDRVPDKLKSMRQWVCHKFPNKAPLCPFVSERGGLKFASCSDSSTWGSFDDAIKQVKAGRAVGIGFQLANGIVGIDIDHCVDGGEISEIAAEIIEQLQSYTEISPSGTGIHIFCEGKLPGGGRKDPLRGLEMYDSSRYFTVTGNAYLDANGNAYPLRDCSADLAELYKKYFDDTPPEQTKLGRKPAPASQEQTASKSASSPQSVRELSDQDILEIAFKSEGGDKFRRLYEGTYSAGEVPAKKDGSVDLSSVDFALVNHLAFWFNCDADRIDRVFRSSRIFRKKWDRSVGGGKTYGQYTIERACKGKTQTFVPYDRSAQMPKRAEVPLPDPPPSPRKTESEAVSSILPDIEDLDIKPNTAKYTYDDTGNAHRFRDAFYKDLRYNHVDKVWYCWDGQRWGEDQTGEVKRRADLLIERMEDEAKKKDEEFSVPMLKLVKRTRSSKAKESMIREAQHLEGIPVLPKAFDRFKDAINVQNGIVELKTGRIRPHKRELMLSMIADVTYDPDAKCPRWMSFLDEITQGDPEEQLYLQRMVGYCLTGSTAEQCVFFLYGNGKNGKSTFLDTISSIMGDYAKNSEADTVMYKDKGGRGASSDVARLKGARLVTTSEPKEGCRLDEAMVKQMTGGEKVTARMLYRAEIEFKPEFKILMGTNVKPIIKGSDGGIWRRVRMIPFTAQIPPEKVDRQLSDKLKAEKSGIFNWALQGAIDWYKQGFPRCSRVDWANEEYRSEMDRMKQFVDDCLVQSTGSSLQASVVFDVYRRWCEQNGERYPMSMSKFSMEMQDRQGFRKQKTSRFNEYLGVDFSDIGRQIALMDSPPPRR